MQAALGSGCKMRRWHNALVMRMRKLCHAELKAFLLGVLTSRFGLQVCPVCKVDVGSTS